MTDQPPTPRVPVTEPKPQQPPLLRVWESAELLGDQHEVIIMHEGQAYRLRRTRQGKLILYK